MERITKKIDYTLIQFIKTKKRSSALSKTPQHLIEEKWNSALRCRNYNRDLGKVLFGSTTLDSKERSSTNRDQEIVSMLRLRTNDFMKRIVDSNVAESVLNRRSQRVVLSRLAHLDISSLSYHCASHATPRVYQKQLIGCRRRFV